MTSVHIHLRRWALVVVPLLLSLYSPAQKGTKPPSLAQLQAAVKREPANPKLHVALGLAYWDQNDYPHAFESFEHAVKVGPKSAEAHNWLGVALLEKGDIPNGIAEFKKAIA